MASTSSNELIQISFRTKLELQLPENPFAVPLNLMPIDISKIVNQLISSRTFTEYDYLINGHLLTTSLDEYVTDNSISKETVIILDVVSPLPAPVELPPVPHPDWVSVVHSVGNLSTFRLSGCYDGIVRLWDVDAASSEGELVLRGTCGLPSSNEALPVEMVQAMNTTSMLQNGVKDIDVDVLDADDDLMVHAAYSNGVACSYLLKASPRDTKVDDIRVPKSDVIEMDDIVDENAKRKSKRKQAVPVECTAKLTTCYVGEGGASTAICSVHRPELHSNVLAVGKWDGSISLYKPHAHLAAAAGEVTKKARKTGDKIADKMAAYASSGVHTEFPFDALRGHVQAVTALKHVNNLLISASMDHSIRSWDIEKNLPTGVMIGSKSVVCLDVVPDATLCASGATDGVVRLHDPRIREGAVSKYVMKGHTNWVSGVAWQPNSSTVFASCSYDGSLKVWDIRTSTAVRSIQTCDAQLFGLDWTNGMIVCGGADSKMHVYSAK